MRKLSTEITGYAIAVPIITLFVVAAAFLIMWLVNYVLSEAALVAVFGGPLDFWKAFCLSVTCNLLMRARTGGAK